MSAPPESFPGTQHTILCPPTSPPPEPNRQRDRQRDREARRRRRREEAAAQHLQQLEDNARFLYRLGFFALPLLWLIALIYFHREHIDENASPVIKSCEFKRPYIFFFKPGFIHTFFLLFSLSSA